MQRMIALWLAGAGSPTVPSTRNEERSWPAGHSDPHFMKVRMAVGAV